MPNQNDAVKDRIDLYNNRNTRDRISKSLEDVALSYNIKESETYTCSECAEDGEHYNYRKEVQENHEGYFELMSQFRNRLKVLNERFETCGLRRKVLCYRDLKDSTEWLTKAKSYNRLDRLYTNVLNELFYSAPLQLLDDFKFPNVTGVPSWATRVAAVAVVLIEDNEQIQTELEEVSEYVEDNSCVVSSIVEAAISNENSDVLEAYQKLPENLKGKNRDTEVFYVE